MVIRDAIKCGIERLQGVQTSVLDTQLIMCKVLGIDKLHLFISSSRELTKEQETEFIALIERRAGGEPTQYILGICEFMGLEFKVTPAVLIPRPDTETLVEYILEKMQGGRILEIGTGSGCIAISLAYYRKALMIDTMDISQAALAVAKENAANLGVTDRVNFIHQNVFDGMEGKYDAIISNPPYIQTDVIPSLQREVLKEPLSALDGGMDGLDFYRYIIEIAPNHLKTGGHLAFEVGHDQCQQVQELMKKSGCFFSIAAIKDLAGINRVVHCQLRAKV